MARTVHRKKLTEWQRRIARHCTSGLTVAAFCRREGIEAGRWKYWQRQVERLTTGEPRQPASRAVFQAVEIIPRRAVVVRFPGGTTLEIPDDRVDLVLTGLEMLFHEADRGSVHCEKTESRKYLRIQAQIFEKAIVPRSGDRAIDRCEFVSVQERFPLVFFRFQATIGEDILVACGISK